MKCHTRQLFALSVAGWSRDQSHLHRPPTGNPVRRAISANPLSMKEDMEHSLKPLPHHHKQDICHLHSSHSAMLLPIQMRPCILLELLTLLSLTRPLVKKMVLLSQRLFFHSLVFSAWAG